MIPFVATKSGLNVFVDGKMVAISTDHLNYQAIRELVQNTDSTVDQIKDLIDPAKSITKQTFGKVTIEGDTMKYEKRVMNNALTRRIVNLLKEGQPIDMFVKFMDNLMSNPSYRAVEELYGFLDACTLPITSDGCFLAYKKVRFDYGSIHESPDGTRLDNSIGATVSMSRNEVDENSQRTCSTGLHACSFEYLRHYGGTGTDEGMDRVVIVKINPKDVVSIPADYNNQKMRVCEYVVVDELPNDGVTQLMDWAYGKRDVAFIRETLEKSARLAKDFFNLEDFPKSDVQLLTHDVTNVQYEDFILQVIKEFGLRATFADYTDRYDRKLTLKNILQFVSLYS